MTRRSYVFKINICNMYLWPKSQIHSTDLPKGKEKWAFFGHLSVWIEEKWGVSFFLNLAMKLRDLTSFHTWKIWGSSPQTSQKSEARSDLRTSPQSEVCKTVVKMCSDWLFIELFGQIYFRFSFNVFVLYNIYLFKTLKIKN